MPWTSNQDLPASVRTALPADAQTRFREVANERLVAGKSEQSAITQAWHVVGLGWEKPEDGGRWVRKDAPHLEFSRAEIVKVDDSLGLVFGFGIVCKIDGTPYFDLQGHHIPEDAMLKAAADFMLHSRASKVMHRGDQDGDVVFAFPLTEDIAKALGITCAQHGLLVAIRPSAGVLAKFKSGEYTGFSIGGRHVILEDART